MGLLFLIGGYVLIFALVPILAHSLERYHTFAARERNILFKLAFFQVCYSIVQYSVAQYSRCFRPAFAQAGRSA